MHDVGSGLADGQRHGTSGPDRADAAPEPGIHDRLAHLGQGVSKRSLRDDEGQGPPGDACPGNIQDVSTDARHFAHPDHPERVAPLIGSDQQHYSRPLGRQW